MNQWLAELFLSMPPSLSDPLIFGSLTLALCWLGYLLCMRAPLLRAVRGRCGDAFVAEQRKRPWRCLLYGSVRKRARLDRGGLYLGNLAALCSLSAVSAAHVLLFIVARRGVSACGVADRLLVTATAAAVGVLCLWTQPGATVERRTRWGFGRAGSVVRAVVWEGVIVAVLLLWLYDAWFFPLLSA